MVWPLARKATRDWCVVHSTGGKLEAKYFFDLVPEELPERVARVLPKAKVLATLLIRRRLLRRRYTGALHEVSPIRSLRDRHNLAVFLETYFENGSRLKVEIEGLFDEEERAERIRSYRVPLRVEFFEQLISEIKSDFQIRPVLVVFNAEGNHRWEVEKTAYAETLVDYERSLKVIEVLYDRENEHVDELKKIFTTFKVRAVPTWILVIPLREGGKIRFGINRFEMYRERYFLKQLADSQREMSARNPEHIREAFEGFVLWGMDRIQKAHLGMWGEVEPRG